MIGRRLLPLLLLGFAAVHAGCADGPRGGIYTVRRSDLILTVESAGSLKANGSATVGPPLIPQVWNYKIVWMAPEGRQVRRGEPVLAFDDSELRQDLERMRGERDQAAKEVEKQELELRVQILELEGQLGEAEARLRRARLKTDVPEDLLARMEIEKDRLDRAFAETEVDSLKLQRKLLQESGAAQSEILRRRRDRSGRRVQELEEGIARMRVPAPRDGMVIYVSRWGGEKHKTGDSVSRMDNVLEIPDLGSMGAEAEIDEADAGRVRVGQKATLRLEAYPDRPITGRVEEISPSIRRQSWDSPLKTRTAHIRLEGERPGWMRPGMRFRAQLEVERVPGALVIPLEAVTRGAGGPVVTRPSGLGSATSAVKLGKRNQSQVEVLEGLEEGDRISRNPEGHTGAASSGGAS